MQPCAIMRRHINLKKNSPGFQLANNRTHPLYLQWVYFFSINKVFFIQYFGPKDRFQRI